MRRHCSASRSPPPLRGIALAGHTTPGRASVALNDLMTADIPLHDPAPLLPRAWDLRDNLTPYGAVYVALAGVLEATLVTTDARIARAPGLRTEIDVVPTS
jgi:predicted nucleic acid-binding protein